MKQTDKSCTRNFRMIREKTQDELNGIITMIKVKQLKEILQENYVVYKSEDKVKEFYHVKAIGKTTGPIKWFFKVEDYYQSYFSKKT